MAIADDFTVNFVTKNIATSQTYVDGIPPLIYSMNEFYSFLQDLFDEPANMDIEVPMSAQTPNEYTMINGWFIDDETIKSLFGGSLTTDSSWTRVTNTTTGIVMVHTTGGTDPVTADLNLACTQDVGLDDGVLLAFDTTRNQLWIRPDTNLAADDWDSTTGNIDCDTTLNVGPQDTAGATGISTWGNIFSLGTIVADTELYVIQVNDFAEVTTPALTKISRWWNEDTSFVDPNGFGGAGAGQIDLMIKVREVGNLIDGGFLTVFGRQSTALYTNFSATVTGGRTPIPLGTADDLNETSGYRHNAATATSGTLVVGEVVTGATSGEGIVTAISGSNPNQEFDYALIGVSDATTGALIDFAGALSAPGGYAGTTGTLTNVNQAANTTIDVTFGHDDTLDINEDDATENYAAVVDCASLALTVVYERLKFLTRRGETGDIDAGAQTIIGESYIGIGEVRYLYDAEGTMGPPTEGEAVTGSLSGATGIITEVSDDGTTGYVIIRQVRGTFEDNDVIQADAQPARSVTAMGSPATVAPVPTAPFGTFAGGKFFGATGVALTNFLASDANNFQLIDSEGNSVFPPNKVTVEITGLEAGDRGVIFRVDTAGGVDVNKTEMSVVSGGASIGATTIEVDSAIAADVPGKTTGGFLRVRDNSDPALTEYRYKYASWSGAVFTLTTDADFGGTTDGETPNGTDLIDSTTNFLTNGAVEVGMEIENTTTNDVATIVTVADGALTTTALTGAGDNLWNTGDGYTINAVVIALVDTDDLYVGIIDGVATGTSLSNTLVHSTDIDVISRVRQSTTGTKILPFVATGGTVTSTGISVAAIRTDDGIVT